MESMVVYSMNGSILSSPLFAGYEKNFGTMPYDIIPVDNHRQTESRHRIPVI